jgi:hypothetical protein
MNNKPTETLTKTECAKIVAIPHLRNKAYTKGRNGEPLTDKHPYYGRSYNGYQYNGQVFTAPSDSQFAKLHDNDIDLAQVTFEIGSYKTTDSEGVEIESKQLNVLNCLSYKQQARLRDSETEDLRESAKQRYYREAKVLPISADFMKELEMNA